MLHTLPSKEEGEWAMTWQSMAMLLSSSVGWSEGDSSSTHLPVRRRGICHSNLVHGNHLVFLSRMGVKLTHPPPLSH